MKRAVVFGRMGTKNYINNAAPQATLISVAPGTRCKSDTNTRLYPCSLAILGDIK